MSSERPVREAPRPRVSQHASHHTAASLLGAAFSPACIPWYQSAMAQNTESRHAVASWLGAQWLAPRVPDNKASPTRILPHHYWQENWCLYLTKWETTGEIGHVSSHRVRRFGLLLGYKEGRGRASPSFFLPHLRSVPPFSVLDTIAMRLLLKLLLPSTSPEARRDGEGRNRPWSEPCLERTQATTADERKKKKANAGTEEKRELSETI